MTDDVLQVICSALGNIDPAQVSIELDPQTGATVAKVNLRPEQLQTALRENGRYVRDAAMQTGIEIDVGMT